MKVSLNWLKNYVDLDVSINEIIEKLTLAGIEVEEVEYVGNELPNVVVGKVVEKRKHPDADKLSVCTVDIGTDNPVEIVCGAPNVAQGMTVPVATIGAVLPGNFKITKAKLRGVVSSGMICSQKELGIGDDHEGIWDLGELEVPTGTTIVDALNLESDIILDLFITPNRADCLSVIGVARELAAVFGLSLKKPVVELFETDTNISDLAKVTVDAPDGNPRYAARVIRNVKITQSPGWMQQYLNAAGMRPINNIVDITNFVMLELGQPLHAFDYDQLTGQEIKVRYSKVGEKFITLDDKEHTLPVKTVLICDAAKPIALGGIMGGQNSEISDQTTTILLESAYFSPAAIRSHAKKIGISTESSQRFERGVDPNGTVFALNRAASLMTEYAAGDIASGIIDVYPDIISPLEIQLRDKKISQILGIKLKESEIKELLASIKIDYDGKMAVVPTFRPDITREIDLIEEIARLYGLDNISGKEKVEILYDFPVNARSEFIDRLKNFISTRRLFEVNTNSMVSEKELILVGKQQPVSILNPLSDDMKYMRTQILSSLLKVCAHNQNRQIPDVQIFEIGKIFYKREKGNGKYGENWQLGILIAGNIFPEQWGMPAKKADLFYLKSLSQDLLSYLKIGKLTYHESELDLYSNVQLEIKSGKKHLGYIGQIRKEICNKFDVNSDIYFAFFNVEDLFNLENSLPQYAPISKFPSIRKDLALLVSQNVSAGELKSFIEKNGGDFLATIDVFDVFTGKHLKEGEKSIAFKLLFQDSERTLTEDEVNERFEKIIALTSEKFDARLRGR